MSNLIKYLERMNSQQKALEIIENKKIIDDASDESAFIKVRWISVNERLPEVKKNDLGYFLIALKVHNSERIAVYEAAYLNEKQFSDYFGDTLDDEESFSGWYDDIERDGDECFDPIMHGTVTHWMVKPEPPKS